MKNKQVLAAAAVLLATLLVLVTLAAEKEVKDVVCGMQGDPENFKFTSEYKEQKYHFCSEGCKQKFDKEPAKFVPAEEKARPKRVSVSKAQPEEEGYSCNPAECQKMETEKDCPMKKKTSKTVT